MPRRFGFVDSELPHGYCYTLHHFHSLCGLHFGYTQCNPIVPADVLIHAGDLTQSGTADEVRSAVRWIASLPHPVKIVVAEYGNWAFQYPQPKLLPDRARDVWASIPHHIDILVTHGPPHGHMDTVGSQHAGCVALLERLQDVKPMLHVFGHVHAGRGVQTLRWDLEQRVSSWSIKNLLSGMPYALSLLSQRDSTVEYRDTTLLVNASIQAGNRDAAERS
ncbi:uncharacterized protein LACBIDRAFT_300196 [Laccaria bicolor S238N-H82]|uniref:Predicted protein n=1 Tax=Laccaria bicolor (strain S238N-H82 / ATCC MYA-4686) TaxID=486041 RepID=B0DG95_LACBS|nr:uncharacterized protein LACBIDRAFT_300196 [Laccaria bicolor S238N-H82]EDR06474.1 predicted protein [Laccaria bicolor S238N-H82]|eukprot:XP_001882846.1 predicted protein [Laccaria bicolor S238N-H82]